MHDTDPVTGAVQISPALYTYSVALCSCMNGLYIILEQKTISCKLALQHLKAKAKPI